MVEWSVGKGNFPTVRCSSLCFSNDFWRFLQIIWPIHEDSQTHRICVGMEVVDGFFGFVPLGLSGTFRYHNPSKAYFLSPKSLDTTNLFTACVPKSFRCPRQQMLQPKPWRLLVSILDSSIWRDGPKWRRWRVHFLLQGTENRRMQTERSSHVKTPTMADMQVLRSLQPGRWDMLCFKKALLMGYGKLLFCCYSVSNFPSCHHVFQPLSTQARRYKYFAKSARDAAQNAPGLLGWTFDIIWRS